MKDILAIRIALRWGVILGLLSIILNTLIYLFSLYEILVVNFILLSILFIGIIYFSFSDYKLLKNEQIKPAQAILLGFLLFLMAGLITGTYDVIYKKYLDPTLVENQLKIFVSKYESMGLPTELVDRISLSSRVWMLGKWALLSITLFYLVLGLFYTLVISTFSSKK